MRVNAEVCYLCDFTKSELCWACITSKDEQKKVFIFREADKAKNVLRGRGLKLRGEAHTVPFTTAEETLICIALSEVSQICSKFIIMIIIMTIIIVQCCHIVSLWLSWIGMIRECYLLFCPATTAPRFWQILRCRAARVFHGAGRGTPLSSQGGTSIPDSDYKLMLKIYCNTQNQARRYGTP